MKKISICLCFMFGIVAALHAAEPLFQFLSPTADVCLYFTTRNTEKNIDKNLWKKVQQDSKAAAALQYDEEEDDAADPIANLLEKIRDKDGSAVFNVFILSLTSPSIVIEGVAEVSCNLGTELEKIRNQNASLERIQTKPSTVYQCKRGRDLDVTILVEKPEIIHFRISLNFDNPIPFGPIKPYKQPLKMPDIDLRDPMFIVNSHLDQIGRIMHPADEKAAELKQILLDIPNCFLTGRVEDKQLKLTALAECKDENTAAQFREKLNSGFREFQQIEAATRIFSDLKVRNSDGSTIYLEGDFELENAWDFMKSLPSGLANEE